MSKQSLILPIFLFLSISLRAQVGGTWEKLNVGMNVIQTGIDFPVDQNLIGYTVSMSLTYNGNGNIFKTTDGGTTWTSIWYMAQAGLSGMDFVSVDTGFVCGAPKTSASWSGFGKTVDGGQTWVSMTVPGSNYNFNDVIFRDKDHGLLLTQTNSGSAVYVTSDGGNTWTTATGVSDGIPNRACYVTSTNYYLVDNNGHIKKSTDDGHSWTTIMSGGGILLGIMFYDVNNGIACGDNGKIFRTTNGGATWSSQTVTTNIWHQIDYEDQNNVYAVGTPEIIFKSVNGGVSWSNNYPQSTYNNAFYDIEILQNGTAWVCGSQGVLMRKHQLVQAGFNVADDSVCALDSARFTASCQGTNLSYLWTFEGGSPNTSTLQNPAVRYNTPGPYGVKLKVTNGVLTDSINRPAYITVLQVPPAPVITRNGNILQSNSVSGNQWYRDGNLISGATSQTYQPLQTGWYWDVLTSNNCSSDTSNNIYMLFVGSSENTIPGLKIYPSPSDGLFNLTFSSEKAEPFDLRIINSAGDKVFEQSGRSVPGTQTIKVDLHTSPPGLYLLTLELGNQRTTHKLLLN